MNDRFKPRRRRMAGFLLLFLALATTAGAQASLKGELVFAGNWVELPFLLEMYKAYMQINPGVTIRTQVVPGPPDMWVWLMAQIAAKTAPPLMSMQPETIQGYKQYVLPLDSYYELKNRYTSGPRWRDEIDPMLLKIGSLGTKNQLSFPMALLNTRLTYNKTAFDKLGIKPTSSWTWADFVKALDRLKNAGYVAWAVGHISEIGVGWPFWAFTEPFVIREKMGRLDVLPKDGTLTNEEFARGFKTGILDPVGDPAWTKAISYIKTLYSYWPEGATADWGYEQARLAGKVGVMWEGSWTLSALLGQMKETGDPWEIGIMPFPTYPPVKEPLKAAVAIPSLANNLGVSLMAGADENQRALAVDFLMFMHSELPQKFLASVFGLPANRNVKVEGYIPENFAPYKDEQPVVYMLAIIMDAQMSADLVAAFQSWYLTKLTDKGLLAAIKDAALKASDRAITANRYDTTKW